MPKVKFDVRGVPDSGFDAPPPGLYVSRILEIDTVTKSQSSGNKMWTVKMEIARGPHKGSWLFEYIVQNDASAWKKKQLLKALGLVTAKKERGTLDTDQAVGTLLQVKVSNETQEDDEGNEVVRARVDSMLPMPDDDDDEELEDDEELDEEEEEEEEEEEGDDEEYTYADLEEMDVADLKAVIEEEELEGIRVTKKSKQATVLAKVANALGLEEEEDEEEEEEEDVEEVEDYNELEPADLRATLKERGLSTKGTKKVMIKRLEADDESADDDDEPF